MASAGSVAPASYVAGYAGTSGAVGYTAGVDVDVARTDG